MDVGPECDYCGHETCVLHHILWRCPYFDEVRKRQDEELATLPLEALNGTVMVGVAPAMRCRPGASHWVQDIVGGATAEQRRLLGHDQEVPSITKDTIEAAAKANLNCRQPTARERGPFAQGVDDFSGKN